MSMRILLLNLVFNTLLFNVLYAQEIYTGKGTVSFVSEAPMEKVQAESTQLEGIIDVSKKNFAFVVDVISFKGFNSPLQREHFNEHYLETDKFPKITYSGNYISDADFSKITETSIICKGKFTIHGITQIEIIKVQLKKVNNDFHIEASFTIKLSDYNIKIPKIIQAKISNEIAIKVTSKFIKKIKE